MCLPHLYLKLLRVKWKASHLDKSLKQKSTVPRIFLKISERNFNLRKICESKNMWKGALRYHVYSLVSDFLLFNVLFWSSIKKFKVQGLKFWDLESWVPGPGSWLLILDYASKMYTNKKDLQSCDDLIESALETGCIYSLLWCPLAIDNATVIRETMRHLFTQTLTFLISNLN